MDAEKIRVSKSYHPEDFSGIISGLIGSVNYKLIIMLFLIFIFLSSDVFITRVLSTINGAVAFPSNPTTYGTIIQGLLLCLMYIVSDVLISREII